MLTLSLAGPFACILLIFGIRCDVRYLLLPWIINTVLVIALDLVYVGYIIHQEYKNMNPVVAITFTFDFFFIVLNVYALLCVVSQYQEYVDGRGTARIESNRSPPPIRYSRRSTMNSVLDSTRRTVTFLEDGILTNGFSPAHNNQGILGTSRHPPSIVNNDNATNNRIKALNGNNHLPETNKNKSKKHVKFPVETIEESETSEGETCDIITSKDDEKGVENTANSNSPQLPDEVIVDDESSSSSPPAFSAVKDANKDRQASSKSSSSPKGPEATPLIKSESESPDEMSRF